MPRLISATPITDEERRNNDRHDLRVVVLVLALFAIYVYLFTDAWQVLGTPSPEALAHKIGFPIAHVFDDDNVDSAVGISLTSIFSSDDERLLFYILAVAAFLSAYFLPLAHKQHGILFWSGAIILLLYGPRAFSGLICAHLVVYLVLHNHSGYRHVIPLLAGISAYLGFFHDYREGALAWQALVGAIAVAMLGYRWLILPALKRPRVAALLRTLVVQSAILTVFISAVVHGLNGATWSLPLGLLLFFWQWERLILYHVDYKDGLIPDQVSMGRYLSVFLTPGQIPNWTWGVSIGQGYAYVHNNFLCEDKNRIVLGGVKLLSIALLYLIFWNWFRYLLVDAFAVIGIPIYRANLRNMVEHFVHGGEVTTASVLATSFTSLVRWTLMWAGVVHFKVGLWRICGYRVDPYIHWPWASTNLVMLWSRFTFHYREFLVRAFYYPAFFRFFRRQRYLRIFFATLVAAGFGNLVWGHIPERLYYRGMEWEHAVFVVGTWPYFLLLGTGIGLTQVYLVWRRRKRKPWTLDRWLWTDVIAAYCTLQYYALIHVFARPVPGSTLGDLFRLFMKGLGLEIP